MYSFLILLFYLKATLSGDVISIISKKDCFEASLLQTYDMMEHDFPDFHTYLIEQSKFSHQTEDNNKDLSSLSKIEELANFHKLNINSEIINIEGPAHQRTFTVQLRLGDETYQGMGSSKKIAKRNAVNLAMKETDYPFPITKNAGNPLTPTMRLNNFAAKFGHFVAYYLVDKTKFGTKYHLLNMKKNFTFHFGNMGLEADLPPKGPFTVRVLVDDELEFYGFGHTIQAARHDAAIKALKHFPNEYVCNEKCLRNKKQFKSPISRIHEMANSRGFQPIFTVIKETGPPHKILFTTQCQFGNLVSEGSGQSKKESKKNASENMLKLLEKPYDIPHYQNTANTENFKTSRRNGKNKAEFVDFTYNNNFNSLLLMTSSDAKKSDFSSKKPLKKQISPKSKLLKLSNSMEISVNFKEIKLKQQSYSLLILGTNPINICLGEGKTWDEAEGNSALKGLKFLNILALKQDIFAGNAKEIDEIVVRPVLDFKEMK